MENNHFLGNSKLPSKEVVVFRLLSEGAVFHTGKCYWLLTEDGRMGCAAVDPSTGEMIPPDENGNVTVIYVLNDTLQGFIQWAREIPDDDVLVAGSILALQNLNMPDMMTRKVSP